MKTFQNYNKFDVATSPIVISEAVGGDGIVFFEQVAGVPNQCRVYADRKIGYELRYQGPSIFTENQFARTERTWGPNGALLPRVNSSSGWVSLLDEDNLGILCIYDEIWMGCYWYSNSTGENDAYFGYDFLFRPRQISRDDYLMWMLKQNSSCGRPCTDTNVLPIPCPTLKCQITPPNDEVIDDETEFKLYDGKVIKAKDFFKRREDREPPKMPEDLPKPPPGTPTRDEPPEYDEDDGMEQSQGEGNEKPADGQKESV